MIHKIQHLIIADAKVFLKLNTGNKYSNRSLIWQKWVRINISVPLWQALLINTNNLMQTRQIKVPIPLNISK